MYHFQVINLAFNVRYALFNNHKYQSQIMRRPVSCFLDWPIVKHKNKTSS
jgi:hypothetical protein